MGLILGFKPFKLFKTEAFEGLFDNDGSVSYIFTQLFYFLLSITIILIMAFVFMINILKSLYYWKLYIYIFNSGVSKVTAVHYVTEFIMSLPVSISLTT